MSPIPPAKALVVLGVWAALIVATIFWIPWLTFTATGGFIGAVIGVGLGQMRAQELIHREAYERNLQYHAMYVNGAYETAQQRAEALFLSSLDATQRAEWESTQHFTVIGSDGMPYIIRCALDYNVYDPEDQHSYCAYPAGPLPLWDRMLGQKLLIETDVAAFKRVAHRRGHSYGYLE